MRLQTLWKLNVWQNQENFTILILGLNALSLLNVQILVIGKPNTYLSLCLNFLIYNLNTSYFKKDIYVHLYIKVLLFYKFIISSLQLTLSVCPMSIYDFFGLPYLGKFFPYLLQNLFIFNIYFHASFSFL